MIILTIMLCLISLISCFLYLKVCADRNEQRKKYNSDLEKLHLQSQFWERNPEIKTLKVIS